MNGSLLWMTTSAAQASPWVVKTLTDRAAEALWWWQYSYVNHWGTHGGAALRALHSVVAHARLDVDDEPVAP